MRSQLTAAGSRWKHVRRFIGEILSLREKSAKG